MFAGSDRGGERAAAIYSLIATAKLNDVDPRAWLADVLAASLTTRRPTYMSCCPGTGRQRKPPQQPTPPDPGRAKRRSSAPAALAEWIPLNGVRHF